MGRSGGEKDQMMLISLIAEMAMWGEQVKLWNVTLALDISKEFIMTDTKYILRV